MSKYIPDIPGETVRLGLCAHSRRDIDEAGDSIWALAGESAESWAGMGLNAKVQKAKEVQERLGTHYWEYIDKKHSRMCIWMGPEEFYSHPYCMECLQEAMEKLNPF
jgi:hypothetical protein